MIASAPSATSSSHSRSASRTFAGIHLVAAPVAERRRRVGGLAERAVERGGVLRRVGDDRRRRSRGRRAPRGSRATRPSIMSLGQTTSAPASTCDTAVRASSSSVCVVVDLAVDDHAAVAVRRVLAEADVGEQHELGEARAQRAQRALDDAVVVPGAGALLVLLLRDAEEHHGADAEPARAPRPRARRRRRVKRDMPGSASFAERVGRDEERHHEVVERRAASRARARAAAPVRRKRRRRVTGKRAHAGRVATRVQAPSPRRRAGRQPETAPSPTSQAASIADASPRARVVERRRRRSERRARTGNAR